MASCPNCDSDNPDSNAFCGQCGAALTAVRCPSCDAPNAVTQRFCGQCGTALSPFEGAGPAQGERKLATVLFADVVGFTSLADRTDHEIVAGMVDAAFRRLGETVTAHGGVIDKFMGDSVMALFGVPVAHDDDAERAVAAALSMRDLGGDLAFSIGVNSGEVTAGAVGRESDLTVIGDTVNVAARLEKAAAPGEVLCGRLTMELAKNRVRFREGQPVVLKGKREPVEVFVAESLRPTDARWSVEGPPLLGRDDELAFLVAQWRRVLKERQPRVLLLSGDAGSGKTRLLSELAGVAAGEATVVRSAYPSYGVLGGARVAKHITEQLGPATEEAVNARIRSVEGVIDPSLKLMDTAAIQQEQLWAFMQLLQEKALARPVLLAIDDMHHADERTLEVVSEVAVRLTDVPALLLLAGRNEPDDWLSRFPDSTSVKLAPLGRPDAAALAAAFAADLPLADEAADFLAERSNGNPLYLRELIAMARSRALFHQEGDRFRLAAYETIPASLHTLLAARLDALESRQKRAIQHVAVLGEAATADRVAELGTAQAETVLRSLVETGLLHRGADGRFATADPLLREVAYETLPRNVRGELHRRAASAIGTADGPERARHLDRAAKYLPNDPDLVLEASEALAVAGEELSRLSRHRDARQMLERAVALGYRRPAALFALATVQTLAADRDAALATLELVRDDPGDPAVAVERDHAAANTRIFDDPAWAVPRLVEVAERWKELGNIDKEAWALANGGVAYFNLSRMLPAVASLERALALFEQVDDEEGAVATSSFLCIANPTDSRVPEWLTRALEYADASGDRGRQMSTLTTVTWNTFFRSFAGDASEVAEAERYALRLCKLADEVGSVEVEVQARSLLVIMARFSGRLHEMQCRASDLQRALSLVRGADSWLGWAAGYSAAVATGTRDASPPVPPDTSVDPVVGMARFVIETELTLSGRPGAALEILERPEHVHLGVMSDMTGLLQALALILDGRRDEAQPWIDRGERAAHRLQARNAAVVAAALRAELSRDPSGLAEVRSSDELGLADVLVLRARAVAGDEQAATRLPGAAEALGAPGLLARLN